MKLIITLPLFLVGAIGGGLLYHWMVYGGAVWMLIVGLVLILGSFVLREVILSNMKRKS